MKRSTILAALIALVAFAVPSLPAAYDPAPPFGLSKLTPAGKGAYDPKDPYAIFVNYELGMHCVGFDISYCCVIPPYNSIQAQALQTALKGALPKLLTPADGVSLAYATRDNTYSEGNKMRYWGVSKDASGNGRNDDPGDVMANYVWTHLFIYKDLEGTIPPGATADMRLRVGRQIQIPPDSGPTGQPMVGGNLVYAGDQGGNKVFTDSMLPEVRDVPLTLTASNLWDALGLPLTVFNDSSRRGTIRSVTEKEFQPYQVSVVKLNDKDGKPILSRGKPVEFIGTNPVDMPNCFNCHSGKGIAAETARSEGAKKLDLEYDYWAKHAPDMSEFMKRQSQASVSILEIHDLHHGTEFLKSYDPTAVSNRLGKSGPINCPDCHGDNVSGNLQEPRPTAMGYPLKKGKPLTEAIHVAHLGYVPMPDAAGRTQGCQVCHPTHGQGTVHADADRNPFRVADTYGNDRFEKGDVRQGAGCYLRRDAHTNPAAKPPFFLNSVGRYMLEEVSMKDEKGQPSKELRGIYCTNCHSPLSQLLYKADELTDVAHQAGKTLRNQPIDAIVKAVAGGDAKKFKSYYADPVIGADGDPLRAYYEGHESATLVKASKDAAGKLQLAPWNAPSGDAAPYDVASAGKDWWLAPAEPHCADCHLAPFVESEGGRYFPIDQPQKYSLFRYSKAHGNLACQSCHESIHGLYPVRDDGPKNGVDLTTHQQALQFSPDGKYAGPVTCAACHRVNPKGVPVQLEGTPYANDYWASVVLLHAMRDGDPKLEVKKLVEKYPYTASKQIVEAGWK